MPGLTRHYEIWIGEQNSGKTHQLRRRARVLAARKRITAIFVFDRLNEHSDLGEVAYNFAEYVELSADTIPRIVVCQFGPDGESYELMLREAIELGGCVLMIDEGYEFAPTGHKWKSDRLKMIVLSGRHLPNSEGKECVTHILCATQYPKSVHHQLWGEARTVMCGKISGENARMWVKGSFGQPSLDDVDRLEPRQWKRLKGPIPELGENRW